MVTGYNNYSGKKGLGHRFGGCPVHQGREDRMEWSSPGPWGHQRDWSHGNTQGSTVLLEPSKTHNQCLFYTSQSSSPQDLRSPQLGNKYWKHSFCTHVSSNCNIKPQLSKACGHLIIQKNAFGPTSTVLKVITITMCSKVQSPKSPLRLKTNS